MPHATTAATTTTSDLPAPRTGALRAALGPVLVGGVGTAVAMWCIALGVHLPGLSVPPMIWVPALIATCCLGPALTCRGMGSRALAIGAGAGLLAALINLLAVSSRISELGPAGSAESGFSGLPASWPVIFLAFIAGSAVLGLIGGALAQALTRPRPAAPLGAWGARFAFIAVAAMAPLLLLGGLVTSTESGMAVPDWPGTFTSNMFTFPLELMVAQPRVFMEHSHRLFGAMVGLVSALLVVASFLLLVEDPNAPVARKPGPLRFAAFGIFAGVGFQGFLGGARVLENNLPMAAAHGVFAQVLFALTGAYAGILWIRAFGAPSATPTRSRNLSLWLGAALLFQLAMGATYRHLHQDHALWTHAGFALVVATLAMLTGFCAVSEAGQRVWMRRLAKALIALVVIQFILGWIAFLAVRSAPDRGPIPTAEQLDAATSVPVWEALITTGHQATGAAIALVASLLIVWTRRWPAPTA